MGSLSNYGEQAWMGHLCGSAYTPAATLYLALCTADPTDAATGASMNEVANANNYSRKAIAFGAASSRKVEQSGAVNFDQISGGATTASHWAIVDSATHGAGNVLAHGAFAVAKNLVAGSTPSVATAEVDVEISSGYYSNYFVHKMLDLMFRNQAYSQPATYVGLTTTTCSDASAGTEVSGSNYGRTLINKAGGGSPAWWSPSGGATDNANTVTLPTPSGSWGTVVGMGLWDASTSGNYLAYDNSLTDQAVGASDTVAFAAGALDASIT